MTESSKIAIQTREIRVFLSSTFRDMDAERTYPLMSGKQLLLSAVLPK